MKRNQKRDYLTFATPATQNRSRKKKQVQKGLYDQMGIKRLGSKAASFAIATIVCSCQGGKKGSTERK